jgi:hypothetical protein
MRTLAMNEIAAVNGGDGLAGACIAGAVTGALAAAATGVGTAAIPEAAVGGCLLGMIAVTIDKLIR